MSSQLGKYTLLRTLGTGANSKVKLSLDKATGTYFAVKIMEKGNPNLDAKFVELVLTEVETMTALNHPNILNLVEYSKEGVVEKANGQKKEVIYIVLELAQGGELFDYVATTGKFEDNVARFYFRQMLDGLEYVHGKGVTHRDLKPENVLYDNNFNLKIADFGFAAPLAGRDGSGALKTKLGTESYMAPEIHMRKPYNGASVDLFATGIILFIMVTQHPPFTRAEPTDPFYRLLCANRQDLFWKAHSKNKPEGFFSEEFKTLINGMLSFDPSHRPSLQDIKAHPWVTTGPVATLAEVQQEFKERKVALDKEAELKRQEKEVQKVKANRQGYRGAHRGEGEEEEEKGEEAPRVMEEYVRIVQKNTEFFSTYDADSLFEVMNQYCDKAGYSFVPSKGKYKAKVQMILDNDETLDLTIRILKVDQEKVCMEFNKSGTADSMLFYHQFKQVKEYMADYANAAF